MKRLVKISLMLMLATTAFACGDDDDKTSNNGTANNGNNGTANNGTTPTNNGTSPNNGTTPTNNGTAPNNGTTPTNNGTVMDCSDNAPTIVVESAFQDEVGLYYFGSSNDGFPYDSVSLEWYGVDVGPGTYTLGENYETCSFCSLADFNCTEESCETVFWAESGTFEVTEYDGNGGQLVGKLLEAVYVEVDIDPVTYKSTPVANGAGFCIHTQDIDIDVELDVPTVTCEATQMDPVLMNQSTLFTGVAGDQAILYLGKTTTMGPHDALRVELVENRGAALTAGTYPIGYENYADCAYCVVMDTGCTETACAKTYLAVTGSIEVTASGGVGDTFSATLTGVEMAEHTIDANGVSTLVPDGAGYCIGDLDITSTMTAP